LYFSFAFDPDGLLAKRGTPSYAGCVEEGIPFLSALDLEPETPDPSASPFGGPAPNTEVFIILDGMVEALLLDLAASANCYCLSLFGLPSFLVCVWEEDGVFGDTLTGALILPFHFVFSFAFGPDGLSAKGESPEPIREVQGDILLHEVTTPSVSSQ
jgi:hypothetical protein